MTVDFNNLRKQTAYSLDRVIKTLNEGIMPGNEFTSQAIKLEDGSHKYFEGNLLIDAEDLQKDIDELSQYVWMLLCCYEEGNPDYVTVYEEVEKSGGIAEFNEQSE